MIRISIADFDLFSETEQRHVAVDLDDPQLPGRLGDELKREARHQICAIKAKQELTLIASVGDRWWTLQQHGTHIELFGLDDEPCADRVFEFLEPFWQTVIFLPWQSALRTIDDAVQAALGTFDDDPPEGHSFSQLPADLGFELHARHGYPVDPPAYDQLDQRHWS